LEQALAARLRELLGQVEWLREARVELVSGPDSGFDLLATLPLANGSKAALRGVQKRTAPELVPAVGRSEILTHR